MAHVPRAQRDASQADQLRVLERTRLHALVSDTKTARRLMTDDVQAVTPSGDMLAREDYLDAVAAGVIDYLVFEPVSSIVVRRSGYMAALRYEVSFDLVAGGTRVTHKGWITELCERHGGSWKLVWEHATAIPNNFDLFLQSIDPTGSRDVVRCPGRRSTVGYAARSAAESAAAAPAPAKGAR